MTRHVDSIKTLAPSPFPAATRGLLNGHDRYHQGPNRQVPCSVSQKSFATETHFRPGSAPSSTKSTRVVTETNLARRGIFVAPRVLGSQNTQGTRWVGLVAAPSTTSTLGIARGPDLASIANYVICLDNQGILRTNSSPGGTRKSKRIRIAFLASLLQCAW